MTAANVKFLTLECEPCPEGQKPARFSFDCVGHNRRKDRRLPRTECGMLLVAEGPHSHRHGMKRDGQGANGGRPQWDWDGDRSSPTFSPSVNCEKACGWHGYIRGGRCVNTQGQDEPEGK